MMVFLIAFIGAALIALVLWKMLAASERGAQVMERRGDGGAGTARPPQRPARPSGPDDDPEFLRELDEKVRKRDDPPPP